MAWTAVERGGASLKGSWRAPDHLVMQYRGFLLPGSRWQFVPGLRVRAAATPLGAGTSVFPRPGRLLLGSTGAHLMTRPVRSWYRVPARPTVHTDLVWDPDDQGRAVLAALGFGASPLAAAEAQPVPAASTRAGSPASTPSGTQTRRAVRSPVARPEPRKDEDKFETKVRRSSGRVRVASNRTAPAVVLVGSGALTLMGLTDVGVLSLQDNPEAVAVSLATFVACSVALLTFAITRTVDITTDGLSIRNGLWARHRFSWGEVHGLSTGGTQRPALQLDTASGPIGLKALVYSSRPPRAWSQVVEWTCFPYGFGRREVDSAKDAILVLDDLFRSRGWQQSEDWNSGPKVVERVDVAAQRLERWNRDAA